MKINLKLSYYQLAYLNELIADNIRLLSAGNTKADKSFYYHMSDIAAKLLKKAIDKIGADDKFHIKLKYYEAYAIHQFLYVFIDYAETEKRRVTREILGEINQEIS